mmetsp:Transcript_50950/g.117253  ORF Transcript_50950/g.117253 Transcript_50950/m.117253 type:complete len:204 (-) Transcript_50950:154-765(-)
MQQPFQTCISMRTSHCVRSLTFMRQMIATQMQQELMPEDVIHAEWRRSEDRDNEWLNQALTALTQASVRYLSTHTHRECNRLDHALTSRHALHYRRHVSLSDMLRVRAKWKCYAYEPSAKLATHAIRPTHKALTDSDDHGYDDGFVKAREPLHACAIVELSEHCLLSQTLVQRELRSRTYRLCHLWCLRRQPGRGGAWQLTPS